MANKLTCNIPDGQRSVLRQLEELLPQIEDGLTKGYSHAAMHGALPELGINISLAYYHRALHKLRKERRERPSAENQNVYSVHSPQHEGHIQGQQPGATKAANFTSPMVSKTQELDVSMGSNGSAPKPFSWKGKGMLSKDWSKF